jgi:hypothetical protein
MDPISAVQAAVYAVVVDTVAPVPVFDRWAADCTRFPYVSMGAASWDHEDDKTERALDIRLGIHVWDKAQTRAPAQAIAFAIEKALHRNALSPLGVTVSDVQITHTAVIEDLSKAHQVVSTYKISISV